MRTINLGRTRIALTATISLLLCMPARAEVREVPDDDPLREVIVTAPRMQSPLQTVLNAKAPRQPLPAHDGADYLKTVAGFSVVRKGGTDGDPVFRGMAASRINLLLDGEQILGGCGQRMDPPTAYVFPESYDRIVIIKGPQTVRHGPGNSAATVLFERDAPRFDERATRWHAGVLAADAERSDLVADFAAGNDTVQARLSGTRAEAGDYADGAGRSVHAEYMRWSANAELGWTPDADTRIALTAARSDGEAAYADRAMDGTEFARDNVGLRLEREHPGAAVHRFEAQVFYNYIDHVMDNYSLRTFTPSVMMPNRAASNPDRRTIGGRVTLEVGLRESRRATVGVDAQENVHRIRSTANQTLVPYGTLARIEDGRFRNAGLFGELVWPLGGSQRIVGGARFDRWEARDLRARITLGMTEVANPTAGEVRTSWLPGGFGRWERELATRPATIYAGIGHVARFPDYWELLPAGRESTGSVSAFHTQPEKTTQLDAGLIYRAARLELSLATFYSRIDDYILVESKFPKGMRRVSVTRNVDATTIGAEVDGAFVLGRGWKLTGSIAYTRGENETDDAPLARIAPLEARLGINYQHGAWTFGALARAVSDQERFALDQGDVVGQDLGRTDGFATMALNVSWRSRRGLSITAGADNLFDRLHAEHLSRGGAMLAGYTQTTRVNEAGRTLWLRIAAGSD
ncbi:MAG: Vitamin B12 transporter BtuB [Steroidobacteraceae bacterium]|nr:Vitamin B12 transporter BtuB [Steroidobacteraceae bacterium]